MIVELSKSQRPPILCSRKCFLNSTYTDTYRWWRSLPRSGGHRNSDSRVFPAINTLFFGPVQQHFGRYLMQTIGLLTHFLYMSHSSPSRMNLGHLTKLAFNSRVYWLCFTRFALQTGAYQNKTPLSLKLHEFVLQEDLPHGLRCPCELDFTCTWVSFKMGHEPVEWELLYLLDFQTNIDKPMTNPYRII